MTDLSLLSCQNSQNWIRSKTSPSTVSPWNVANSRIASSFNPIGFTMGGSTTQSHAFARLLRPLKMNQAIRSISE